MTVNTANFGRLPFCVSILDLSSSLFWQRSHLDWKSSSYIHRDAWDVCARRAFTTLLSRWIYNERG